MAKKKRSRRRSYARASSSGKVVVSQTKIKISLVNLAIFTALALISYGLHKLNFANDAFTDIFWIVSLITAFIAIAFLISYLVLKIMSGIKR